MDENTIISMSSDIYIKIFNSKNREFIGNIIDNY